MGRVEPGHWAEFSRDDAERCCVCRECKQPLSAEDGRGTHCRACYAKALADRPPPDPSECRGIECVIGRGRCNECGSDNDD